MRVGRLAVDQLPGAGPQQAAPRYEDDEDDEQDVRQEHVEGQVEHGEHRLRRLEARHAGADLPPAATHQHPAREAQVDIDDEADGSERRDDDLRLQRRAEDGPAGRPAQPDVAVDGERDDVPQREEGAAVIDEPQQLAAAPDVVDAQSDDAYPLHREDQQHPAVGDAHGRQVDVARIPAQLSAQEHDERQAVTDQTEDDDQRNVVEHDYRRPTLVGGGVCRGARVRHVVDRRRVAAAVAERLQRVRLVQPDVHAVERTSVTHARPATGRVGVATPAGR